MEPQTGQEASPLPADGCRSATFGAYTTLLLPSGFPEDALSWAGGQWSAPEGHGFPSAVLLAWMPKARPGDVDSSPQPGWHGVWTHLWVGWGARLRAASKAGSKWTGALGLSLTLVPPSAWEMSGACAPSSPSMS